MIEINAREVQVTVVESGFQARNLGTEPARYVAVGVNRDAYLTLLYDGVNLNRAEGVGANAHMHLAVHLQIAGGTRHDRRSRNHGRSRRGVEHLVSLWKRGIGTGLRRGH